jgi:hypothetical protein
MRNGSRGKQQRLTLHDAQQRRPGAGAVPGDVVAALTHPSAVVRSGSPTRVVEELKQGDLPPRLGQVRQPLIKSVPE